MRFIAYAIVVVIGYGVMTWRGVNLLPTSRPSEIPASVRSSPGGYRSYHSYYHFHSFHGGK